MEKAQVYAKHNRARISSKKVRVVMDLIRGKDLERAKLTLAFDSTKASAMLLKVLKSAEANAVKNNNLDPSRLFVAELYANEASTYKRGRPASKSRYSPILKRNSNIVIGLSEKLGDKVEEKKGEKK